MCEIQATLQKCEASKGPRCDGFNFKFVKEHWKDIGQEVYAFEVKNFRLISMIRTLYKIIAKISAKRLSMVLPDLIGETQTTFIKSRQILDRALIANEVVWWIKETKLSVAVLKLDFQKSYVSV
ncbi:hypothetical protein SASPL_118407 [Salvia splendens]|uniref:Reverse transcriptase domain-containing protein n=1 Tax=Salvia splendens TaxID=180675 RepID=A0A8X8Y1K3_SALSN|nr:hypothetical protein SASPL_118407 [Salvia splendens]